MGPDGKLYISNKKSNQIQKVSIDLNNPKPENMSVEEISLPQGRLSQIGFPNMFVPLKNWKYESKIKQIIKAKKIYR